jgi:protein subunit release factor A
VAVATINTKKTNQSISTQKRRIDCVFGSMNGNGETIYKVLENYDEWKRRQDELDSYNKQRQRELVAEMKRVLGENLFTALKNISSQLQNMSQIGSVTSQDIQNYVRDAMALFRKARTAEESILPVVETTPDIPQNDVEALHFFSSIVALLPDDDLRERILLQIYNQLQSFEPSKKVAMLQRGGGGGDNIPKLADLNEDELIESFVRGSGAGGQKINKTANKVLLIHQPTQLRVECQDTRSLQQNRKIARKRLKLKLDEYLNGSESVTQRKIANKINKKQKVKAKNKARLRKKQDALVQENENLTEDKNESI